MKDFSTWNEYEKEMKALIRSGAANETLRKSGRSQS